MKLNSGSSPRELLYFAQSLLFDIIWVLTQNNFEFEVKNCTCSCNLTAGTTILRSPSGNFFTSVPCTATLSPCKTTFLGVQRRRVSRKKAEKPWRTHGKFPVYGTLHDRWFIIMLNVYGISPMDAMNSPMMRQSFGKGKSSYNYQLLRKLHFYTSQNSDLLFRETPKLPSRRSVPWEIFRLGNRGAFFWEGDFSKPLPKAGTALSRLCCRLSLVGVIYDSFPGGKIYMDDILEPTTPKPTMILWPIWTLSPPLKRYVECYLHY